MKQPDISNYCVDSLRSYFSTTYGIKLKSGHAHEIVAAFFGFNSRIAMLAIHKDALNGWDKGDFALSSPPISLINQRLQSILELPSDLPSSNELAEIIYSVLVARLHLHRKLRMFFKSGMPPIKWEMTVTIEHNKDGALSTVNIGNRTSANERLRYSSYVIHLPRIAGSLDYGIPSVHATQYSGLVSKYSDEELDKMYPIQLYPVGANHL